MSITSSSNAGTFGKKAKNTREAKESPKLGNNQFEIEYLVVAGGGGGGFGGHGSDQRGGGGGGGGFRNSTEGEETGYPATIPEAKFIADLGTNYTVTVGAGGAAHANGQASEFGTIKSVGSGKGGQTHGGFAGGTRAGGSHAVGSGGGGQAGSYGSYNLGGCGSWNQGGVGANNHGGGGAGGNGGNTGGAGKASSITGSSVTYGAGKTSQAAHVGAANTGDGGGGGTGANVNGSAGGSGIVVLKYKTNEATITVGGSLTSSSTTSGEHTIVTFTAGSDNVSFA
jgi:hypothetical protein